jgi:hypothetical protein
MCNLSVEQAGRHNLLLGVVGLILSVIQVAIGASATSVSTNVNLGAWWAGLFAGAASLLAIVTGVSGDRTKNPSGCNWHLACVIAAIIACIVTGVGSGVDGIAYGVSNCEQ